MEGDTLVSISGSKVCVNGLKKEGAKSLVGSLAHDCNFEVGDLIIPLKAGEIVKYSPSTGKLTQGILRADFVYNSSVGEIVLKEGTAVAFNGTKLIGGSLAKDASIKIGTEMITCTANEAMEYDIRFDNQGRIREFTAVQDVKWNAGIDLVFPAKSRLVFKGGDLSKVVSVNASSFDLNGTKIEVQGHAVITAYDFNANGELATVNAGAGNAVEIEGQMVKVKEGTEN